MDTVLKQYVLLVTIFVASSFSLQANKKLTENYVNQYKEIAIAEMFRSGIPASIKLAQGILESDLGRSPLASQAKNHFGIKCGTEWSGMIYYKHDDDIDSTGMIVESCFRAYENPAQSYKDHSDFLTNPSKESRYGFLFELSTTDYVGWANGLKFAGYASDPSYPAKLIKIIENNRLYQYDVQLSIGRDATEEISRVEKHDNPVQNNKEAAPSKYSRDKNERIIPEKEDKESTLAIGKYKVQKINDVKMVFAFGGESIKELALRNKKDVHTLLEYNEGIQSQDEVLESGEIVYFDKKKKSVEDVSLAFHTVSKGETLYQIAQKYGVRLESLMVKNNIPRDAEPLQGELLSLDRHLTKNESPKYRKVEKMDLYMDFGALK